MDAFRTAVAESPEAAGTHRVGLALAISAGVASVASRVLFAWRTQAA